MIRLLLDYLADLFRFRRKRERSMTVSEIFSTIIRCVPFKRTSEYKRLCDERDARARKVTRDARGRFTSTTKFRRDMRTAQLRAQLNLD